MTRTPKDVAPRASMGGRQPSTVAAAFTAQIIGLVLPAMKDRVLDVADQYGVSQSVIVRRCVEAGLGSVERALRDERERGLI